MGSNSVLRIRDVLSRIPDPDPSICLSRIPDLESRISDPGSRISDLGSRILVLCKKKGVAKVNIIHAVNGFMST
jgi:hypothetical protein